jgi:periplasmic protein TonB
MDRLHKKCAIASAGVHSLLLLILLIGPAFLKEQEQPDTMPILDFIPLKTVDALVSGGGNPNAAPQQTTFQKPPESKPVPQPPTKTEVKPKLPDPEPIKPKVPKTEPIKPKPAPDSLEVQKKRVLPDVNTKLVERKDPQAEARKRAEELQKQREREQAEQQRRVAQTIGKLANNLRNELSSSTTIELKGPGGGGVPYANWLQAVKSIFSQAWTVPDGVTDDNDSTTASVTIARDGRVVTYRIIRSSGNREVDRSVLEALGRVKYAVPLPDEAKEDERTVSINFNVRARRQI